MKIILLAFILSSILSVIFGAIFIPILRKFKARQTVLKYVETHKGKNGTPTMGGLFFIVSSCIIFIALGGLNGRIGVVSLCIGLAFMVVGFIDDFIKIKFKRKEGLTAIQKILFQTSIAVLAGVFAYLNGLTIFYVPFTKTTIDLGVFSILLIVLIFLATTNSVNLTDGLDGLAGNVSVIYLIFISVIISIQINNFKHYYLDKYEYNNLILLSTTLIGALFGFLLFNTNKASVFMGDTGSLSLGGFIAGISIFSSNSLFIPLLGITFVCSSVSVILQVARFKKSGKRFFLMAPIHHHFQMKGLSETKIAYLYSFITCIIGALLVIFYL